MPELPEVETIRRRLQPVMEGARLRSVVLGLPRMLEVGTLDDLQDLVGCTVGPLERHGKYLLVPWWRNAQLHRILVVHLGMTGQLTWHPAGATAVEHFRRLPSGYVKALGPHPVDKHTHLLLDFEGDHRLLFRDPRTFGKLLLLAPSERSTSPRLVRMGPDALGLPLAEFVERFLRLRGKRSVKAVLLDQGVLAGVGNIYADEACFTARIAPAAKAEALSRASVTRLAKAVDEALERGLANAGTTFRDFVHPDGTTGGNLEDLRVYARGGEPCLECGTTLRKGVVAQRGTVWCPRCQRL
jgi:formamidopyrimidine-DNA glycosylase